MYTYMYIYIYIYIYGSACTHGTPMQCNVPAHIASNPMCLHVRPVLTCTFSRPIFWLVSLKHVDTGRNCWEMKVHSAKYDLSPSPANV